MIGYEQDSVPSVIEDLKRLRSHRLDISQICVMTPLPMTPLWDEIKSRYGIIDQDYHHFDTKHLVWKHPRISPDEMISLLGLGFKLVYPRRRVFQTASKFIRRYIEDKGYIKGIFYLMKKLIIANTFDYHQSR